jgi:hypothetical protein
MLAFYLSSDAETPNEKTPRKQLSAAFSRALLIRIGIV